MLESLIGFFSRRHLLSNLFGTAVIAGGIAAWFSTAKEELPDVTFDFVRISASYPGAPASDVEYYVARVIEEKVRGLDGVHKVESTSSVGSASVMVELEPGLPDVDAAVTEIRNAVADARLPVEVVDDPNVRIFKTSKKAILDIALINLEEDQLLRFSAAAGWRREVIEFRRLTDTLVTEQEIAQAQTWPKLPAP